MIDTKPNNSPKRAGGERKVEGSLFELNSEPFPENGQARSILKSLKVVGGKVEILEEEKKIIITSPSLELCPPGIAEALIQSLRDEDSENLWMIVE